MDLADAVARAALENARWCDRVCRAHGAPGELHEAYWMDRHRVPPFHPRLVTLAGPSRAAVQLEAVRALVAHDPGSALAVKDSFSALDLAPLGFRRLFEAAWIVWPSGQAAPEPGGPIRWRALRYASELDGWEEAWRGTAPPAELAGIRMFPAELLDAPDVQFIAGEREGRVVATGILHASGGVVGLSNLSGAVGPALRACVAAARAWRPGLPVVGYEHGDELQAAEAAGFERAATLVVWGRAAWGAGTARGATER